MNRCPAAKVLVVLVIAALARPNQVCRAADTNDLDALAKEDADLASKALEIPLWDKSFDFKPAIGYKDNVLLNDADRKNSAFFDTGLDVTILRLPLDDWEFHFLLTGDDIRYWRNQGVNHEDTWLAESELKRAFGSGWKAGVSLQYTYLNEVVDLFTLTDTVHEPPTKIEGHGFTLRPLLEKQLGSNNWVKLELEGTREFLTEPADSFTRVGPKLTLGHAYGIRSEVSLSYSALEYYYDHESDVDPEGVTLPNTSLRALKQEVALSSKHVWDAGRHWQNTTKLSYAWNRDNGSGYYDYAEYGASEQLRSTWKTLEIKGEADILYSDSPYQPVDFAGTPLFRQTLLTFNLRIEKNVTRALKIFAEYEREISLSDSADEVYHVNTCKAGVDWEF